MKKRKLWTRILFLLFALCLLTAGVRCIYIARQNTFVASFYRDDGDTSPYEAGVPMEEMDIRALCTKYIGLDRAYMHMNTTYRTFRLPCDLTYWQMENGEYTPVFMLKAGTKVLNLDLDAFMHPGYGYESFPTYSADWRYVIPFLVETEPSSAPPIYGTNDPRVKDVPFYYVQTDEICEVTRYVAALETDGRFEDPEYRRSQEKYLKNTGRISYESAVYFDADYMLCEKGAYLSPNLRMPYFDTANILLLSAAGVLLAVYIVLQMRRRKA